MRPDVVVLNITMPLVNGFQAAREIKKQPELSFSRRMRTSTLSRKPRRIGVRAYIPKSKISHALVEALEAAVKGDEFIVLE